MTQEELVRRVVRMTYLPYEDDDTYSARIPRKEHEIKALLTEAEPWWLAFLLDWYSKPPPVQFSAEELEVDYYFSNTITAGTQLDILAEVLAEWAFQIPEAVFPTLSEAMENPDHRELCLSACAWYGNQACVPYLEPWVERLDELSNELSHWLVECFWNAGGEHANQCILRIAEILPAEKESAWAAIKVTPAWLEKHPPQERTE